MHRNSVPDLDAGDAWSEGGDIPRDFASEDVGQLHHVIGRSLAGPQIAPVDTAGAHADNDLARTRNLIRKILVDEDLGGAVLPEERCLHAPLPASESALRRNMRVRSVPVVRFKGIADVEVRCSSPDNLVSSRLLPARFAQEVLT